MSGRRKDKLYYQRHREQKLIAVKKYYIAHKEQYLQYGRTRHKSQRSILFSILGDKCSNPSCPIPKDLMDYRCLNVDHTNGTGYVDKKRFSGSRAYLKYYSSHPDEAKKNLQLLCVYCHTIKTHDNNEYQTMERRLKMMKN